MQALRLQALADVLGQVEGNEGLARDRAGLKQQLEEFFEIRKGLLDGNVILAVVLLLLLVVVLVVLVVILLLLLVLASAAREGNGSPFLSQRDKEVIHEARPAPARPFVPRD